MIFKGLYTLWLFTLSDIKTFVIPQTSFGVLSALSGPLLTPVEVPDAQKILWRLPYTFAWTWFNTLVFTIANQRRPESILEDQVNKPWRPLPMGRLSPDEARHLILVSIPTTLAIVYLVIGALEETMLLFCLTWMYNDLGGSDDNFVVRNLIIASAYPVYGLGALRVTCDLPVGAITTNMIAWSIVTGAIIFTTMSIQDLKDMAGDRLRQRETAPLIVGECPTRYFLAFAITVWSIICPFYWGVRLPLMMGMTAFGAILSYRLLMLRSVSSDRTTWKLWSYWLIGVYGLPSTKYAFGGLWGSI